MISIETEYLPSTVGKQSHVRARAHGCSAVYVTCDRSTPGDRKVHGTAALKVAQMMIACEPHDLVVKAVHVEPRSGFAVWVAFDRRKG